MVDKGVDIAFKGAEQSTSIVSIASIVSYATQTRTSSSSTTTSTSIPAALPTPPPQPQSFLTIPLTEEQHMNSNQYYNSNINNYSNHGNNVFHQQQQFTEATTFSGHMRYSSLLSLPPHLVRPHVTPTMMQCRR
jgi:hypothetical protein